MDEITCAHCATPITDRSTMQEQSGRAYCCMNCVAMASGAAGFVPGAATCAHCELPIVAPTTQVERDGRTYCCNNCAVAMGEGAARRS